MSSTHEISASNLHFQYVLESESPANSDHDTESVHSIQDKETDFVRDTSDTDYDTDIEFDVASLSEDDEHMAAFWGDVQSDSSSGTDDVLTRDDVLAAICATTESEDSSDITMWAAEADTDGEEETDETANHSPEIENKLKGTLKMKTCLQCKGPNYNSFYRYCEKCYQVRKKVFPPRPRGYRSRHQGTRKTPAKKTIVEPEKLRMYLTDLTQQDSGVGTSSQESISTISSSQSEEKLSVDLGLDKIIVPERLMIEKEEATEQPKQPNSSNENFRNDMLNEKEMCIVCTTSPKNGIFCHGSFGHMCCCYKCAMKVWTKTKRCPACNCKVNNVLKVFLR